MLALGKYDWQRPTSQDTVKVSRVSQICIYINEIQVYGMNIGSLLGSATHLKLQMRVPKGRIASSTPGVKTFRRCGERRLLFAHYPARPGSGILVARRNK
jgi:hypothetical protein